MTDRRFHDVTLIDMANADGPVVPMGDLCLLRHQWPLSVVSGMTRKQTDLELMRHECKWRFFLARTGCCTYCGKNIKNDMARHVSNFHLDLAQLWWCPVAWCTQ